MPTGPASLTLAGPEMTRDPKRPTGRPDGGRVLPWSLENSVSSGTSNAEDRPGEDFEPFQGDVLTALVAHTVVLLPQLRQRPVHVGKRRHKLAVGIYLHNSFDSDACALSDTFAERDSTGLVGWGRHTLEMVLQLGFLSFQSRCDGIHAS